MTKTLLQITQDVADRLGLTRPSTVIGSADAQVRQLLGFAGEAGLALARAGDWEALKDEHTFVTVAQAEQSNTPVPTDLDRFIPDTFYNRTSQRKVIGPITSQLWQQMQARPASVASYICFRKRAGAFLMTPTPTAGDTIAYEYVSNLWVLSSANVGKTAFSSDDDTIALDDELLIQSIRWRWKQAKGLEYGEDMLTYERNLQQALGNDGGAMALDIGGGLQGETWRANLPEGSFGL